MSIKLTKGTPNPKSSLDLLIPFLKSPISPNFFVSHSPSNSGNLKLGTLAPNPVGGFAILNLKLLLFEIQ
ncbi:hypothetical protein [Sphingobacterium zeae]|uniref:hypothetical protein n=1 Tax=Sphingobacterium zeae TaxID=1776859 RepID=UPI003618B443